MYYICESDKPNILLKKLNIIKLEGNKVILPINKKNEKDIKREIKLAKKIKKFMQSTNSNKVVLSKEVQKHITLLNQLYTYELDIVNGRWLFYMLLPEVLEYIMDKQNWNKEQTIIYILVNDISDNMIKMLKMFTRYI